ncbi:molybdenum cofactor guanylyltransferase [Microbacterium sp. NPDC096154]|uniref:molybdenum cofactor guanylyltransferase n=1 Tax=Microbacterium sp. NPDC096154 TaxID=3155549 RepID=UPI00332B869F
MMRHLRGIVLAGGRSSRMGGRHKPAIPVSGAPMVAHAVGALRAIGAEVIVVGSPEGVPDGVPVVQEDPPFGGPLSAVAAGLDHLATDRDALVILLGGDMPFTTPAALSALAEAAAGGAACAEDESGSPQPLCAAWNEALLRDRIAAVGDAVNRPLRILYDGFEPRRVALPRSVLRDIDTPDDLAAAGG